MKTVGLWGPKLRKGAWRSVLVVCALSAGLLAPVQQAFANAPLNASDEVGQTDDSGNAVWTTSYDDNRHMPNSGGFGWMSGVVMDRTHHKFYVSDETQNEILVYNLDANNEFADRVSDYILGQSTWSNFGGTAATTKAGLSAPNGMALDVAGQRLFVADRGNNRVLEYDVSSLSNGMNAAHVLGQATFTAKVAATSQAGMNAPQAVAYDPTRDLLFVADDGVGRVLVYDVASITDGENAVNVLGKANFTSTAACTVTSSNLCRAFALAYDDGGKRLFVSDYSKNRILVYNIASITDGMAASNVLGQPNFTSSGGNMTATGLVFADQLEYDATNSRLVVSDYVRILFYDATAITDGMAASNVLGQPDFTTGVGPAGLDQSHVYYSMGTAYNPADGMLYVADRENYRLMVFDINAITNGENAVDELGQTSGDGSINWNTAAAYNDNVNSSGFEYPNSTAVDAVHHRLFVADPFTNRVTVYNLDASNNLTSRHADAVLGQIDLSHNDSATSQSGVNWAQNVAYDLGHNWLYVSDYFNDRVLIYDVATITNGENAVHVLGRPDFTSTGSGTTASTFDKAYALEYDNVHKRLFVVDEFNARVLVFDMSGTVTDGMDASYVLGASDFVGGFTSTDSSYFSDPYAIAYDETHNRLFVADFGIDRILVFNLDGIANGMDASYVLGEPDFVSDNATGSPNQSDVYGVTGMEYDATTGQLWVSDNFDRVLMFDTNNLANNMNASAVIGQPDFVTQGGALSQSRFGYVNDIALDTTSRHLYVASDANRITIFDLPRITTTSLPGVTAGDAYSQTIGASGLQGASSFAVTGGALPPGLLLQSNGLLSGTPTTAGTYNFTVRVTDDNGSAGQLWGNQELLLMVDTAPQAPSGGSTTTSTQPAADTSTTPILLNNDTMYTDSQGSVQTMTTGDAVTFVLAGTDPAAPDAEQHTVTVNDVTDTYADITVASTPQTFRMYVGQSQDVDVDRDGHYDLNVRLLSITNKQAQFAFRQLAATPVSTTAATPTAQNATDTNAPKTTQADIPWGMIIGIISAIMIVIALVFWLRRNI